MLHSVARGLSFLKQLLALFKFEEALREEWDNAAAVSRAFSIGPKESAAVSNLQSHVKSTVTELLKEATRGRGMRLWITHDMLARDMFNLNWSSGQSGALAAWVVELTNKDDDMLVAWSSNDFVILGDEPH